MKARALFRCRDGSTAGRARVWAYVAISVPTVAVWQQTLAGEAAWWYRLAISLAIVAANVGIIMALHRSRRVAGSRC